MAFPLFFEASPKGLERYDEEKSKIRNPLPFTDKKVSMQWLIGKALSMSRAFNFLAGIAITFVMLLTVLDVILRFFRMPIVGTYELVAFSGAVVIGFAVPLTTFFKGHVLVDFFIMKFKAGVRKAINIVTRLLGIFLFFTLGFNLILMGLDLYRSGEVSLTLQLPFYPVALGLGVSCFVQCFVLTAQIFQVLWDTYE